MSIALQDNLQINAPKPIDSRYFNGLSPWSSVNQVNTTITTPLRYRGLVVNIAGVEYWYVAGIGDSDLVIKKLGVTDHSLLTNLDYANSWHTGFQPTLWFTPEDVANKSTDVIVDAQSTTKYPSIKLFKDYADSLVAGLLDYRGGYDAHINLYPSTWGSGDAWAIMKGDMRVISVAGTLSGKPIQVGDSIIANRDNPGQTDGYWNTFNSNVSYVPEDQANKENITIDTSTTKYPTVNLLRVGLAPKAPIDNPVFTGTVQMPTGTTTKAPQKFVAWPLLTVPVSGTVEFDWLDYYVTI